MKALQRGKDLGPLLPASSRATLLRILLQLKLIGCLWSCRGFTCVRVTAEYTRSFQPLDERSAGPAAPPSPNTPSSSSSLYEDHSEAFFLFSLATRASFLRARSPPPSFTTSREGLPFLLLLFSVLFVLQAMRPLGLWGGLLLLFQCPFSDHGLLALSRLLVPVNSFLRRLTSSLAFINLALKPFFPELSSVDSCSSF